MTTPPKTRYAKSGSVHIAYQAVGDAPLHLVLVPGWVSHIEYAWDDPWMSAFLRRLASFSRLILLDRRGTGLSDRVGDFPPSSSGWTTSAPSWTPPAPSGLRSSGSPRGDRCARCLRPRIRNGRPRSCCTARPHGSRGRPTIRSACPLRGSTDFSIAARSRGVTCWTAITRSRGGSSRAFAAARWTPPATVSLRRSMGPRAAFAARRPSTPASTPLASKCERGSTRASARSSARRWAASPCTSERAWPPSRARARFSSRIRVKDLVAGSGVAFEDRGPHTLKGVPGEWRLYAVTRAA